MKKLEASLTALLAAAAVIVAAAVAKREFFPPPQVGVGGLGTSNRELPVEDWQELLSLGHVLADSAGPVKIIVLADFECPACKRFHETLMRVLDSGAAGLDIRYVHTPLEYHRFALPSARMFECVAADGDVAERLATLLFQKQDSLGLIPWSDFASRAGARDPISIAECAKSADSARFPRINGGIAIGTKIRAPGTPTVVIDGVLQAVPPDEASLRAMSSSRNR